MEKNKRMNKKNEDLLQSIQRMEEKIKNLTRENVEMVSAGPRAPGLRPGPPAPARRAQVPRAPPPPRLPLKPGEPVRQRPHSAVYTLGTLGTALLLPGPRRPQP